MKRRSVLSGLGAVGVAALAGCLGGGSGPEPADADYGDWFSNTDNYDGEQDLTGESEVTVAVGADGGLAFEPPAIRVSSGTTVVWEWTGRGGGHNVVATGGSFASDLSSTKGTTFEFTFEDSGLYRYYCEPHQGLGMKGGVRVEE